MSPRKSCTTDEQAVRQIMLKLELLAKASEPLACILMTHLLPIAGELRMHDVFDSIGLWIWHCDSERLTDHLKRIAQSEEDPDMRSHYEWLIQGRCSSTTSTPTRDGSS